MHINPENVAIGCFITALILIVVLPLLFPLSLMALESATAVYWACKVVLYALRLKRILPPQTKWTVLFRLLVREGFRGLLSWWD